MSKKEQKQELKNAFKGMFLIALSVVMLLTLYISYVNGFTFSDTVRFSWMRLFNTASIFYLITFFIVLFIFLKSSKKSIKTFLYRYKWWFISLVLSVFSFAIVEFIVEVIQMFNNFLLKP